MLYTEATPDYRSTVNDRGHLPPHQQQHQPREESAISRAGSGGNNDGDGGDNNDNNNNNNNGLLQVIESEVWDASENVWKSAAVAGTDGGNRWTNEKGFISPSPAEVVPPEGWAFLGDWKIVVSSGSSSSSNSGGSGGGGGDSKGWEYQFQYLQPPKRRRIWLRNLTQTTKLLPRARQQPESRTSPSSRLVAVKPLPTTATTTSSSTRTKLKKSRPHTSRLTRTMQRIRDDWNYKGLGFNLYKSFIFPSSIGIAIRLPLTIHFDTFDRNPAWPIISSSAAVFYPPMCAGFLSTSVHVEWVKWMAKCILGLIPHSVLWILYRLVLPLLWTVASIVLFPIKGIKGINALPPRPTKIPNGSWWTGKNIAKPQYNSEMSERIGCSVSYRWSRKRGYEFRVSYWHAYLPTLLVYQQFLSQLQERLKGSIASSSSSSSSPSSSTSSVIASSSPSSSSSTKSKTNWWRKHTASLGASTSGPIPDTPPISCSANLSLSGLYWGARQGRSRTSTTSTTTATTTGSRTDSSATLVTSENNNDDTMDETDEDYKNPARLRNAPIKKGSSLS